MRDNGPLTRDSYVRYLPFNAIRRLAMELDSDSFWERMIEFIPRSLSSEDPFTPRYTIQHVSMFAREYNRHNGSPTRAILQDWGTQNCTLQHLITVLEQAELIEAANFLKEEILHESPEEEEEEAVNLLPIPAVLLPPLTCDAVPGKQPHRVFAAEMAEPVSYTGPLPEEKTMRQPVQNDLSLTPPSSRATADPPSFDRQTMNHQRNYESFGGKEVLAEGTPNLNANVCMEKHQGKGVEKRIERELLEPVHVAPPSNHLPSPPNRLTPPPDRCTGAAVRPVVLNTGEMQHIRYADLHEVTDGFNEVKHCEGGRLIGKGGFGTVHLGLDCDGKRLAVKVLRDNTDIQKKQFQVEVKTLSEHQHRNLVSLWGYSCDGPKPCIVFEYLSNGSLEDRLACLSGTRPLPAGLRIDICKGSAEAVVYLNNSGFIHRDIKTANILLDSDFVPKLGDFATARLGPSGSSQTKAETSMVIGTSAYLAPEAHQFDVSSKLDSYSFGVVILELLTGLPAFDAAREDKDLRSHMLENCDDVMKMVDHRAGEWTEATARGLYDVAKRCVEYSKRKRVLVSDVLQAIKNM